MVQFKLVEPVAAGDPISSTSHNDLALAFNQRILCGAGDAAWRIVWNAHSLMRQVRNPSGGAGLPGTQQWPASDEWWKVFALVDNSNRCGATNDAWFWPVVEPGTEEGANVANPMMAFVYGRDFISQKTRDFEPEVNRLTDGSDDPESTFRPIDVAVLSGTPSQTAASAWGQAKQQRGTVEIYPPYRSEAPAYEAAHSAYSWRYPSASPYLKTYTCFEPVAKDEGNCPRIDGIVPPYWRVKFTPLVPGFAPLSFPTCPGVSGHVQHVARLTDRYIVYFQDAPPISLPYTIYIEGPYDGGGALAKHHSELLTQAINKYVIEMRGNYAERLDNGCVDVKGAQQFDFQKFFSSQYAMAPAATGYYDNAGVLQSYGYPTFDVSFSGSAEEQQLDAGTMLDLSVAHPGDGSNEHYTGPAFVFSAFQVIATNTLGITELEFLDEAGNPIHLGDTLKPCEDGSRAVLSVQVPASPTRSAVVVKFLGAPVNPGSIRVRLKQGVRLAREGSINVEILEQVPYIPDIQDAYVVLRCGTTNGAIDGPDTHGGTIDSEKLRTLWAYYSSYGCIVNPDGVTNLGYHPTGVNFNSIYESARQLLNENLRMVPRGRINRYTVADETSTLYFSRYALGRGGQPGGTRTYETEVKPIVGTKVIEAIEETNPKPLVEYVVRRKGNDNIKPALVINPTAQRIAEIQGELPLNCYQHENSVYCDDYLVYGNVKYTPPGYNWASPNNGTLEAYPSDRDLNFDHVLVGMTIPTYSGSAQVPAGYMILEPDTDIKLQFQETVRSRSYVDAFGQNRTELVDALKIAWISKTRYGSTDNDPPNRDTAWKNILLHPTPQYDNANVMATSGFKYLNGFRYAVQRRFWSGVQHAWLPWETIVDTYSGVENAIGTYGFDPNGVISGNTGTYFAEDRLGYGKVVGVDVEYRVIAKPVVDVNSDKLVLYQRANFLPVQMTWTGQADKTYKVKRTQVRKEGDSTINETVEVSDPLTGLTNYFFIDLPTLCPIRITPGHELTKDSYQTKDEITSYQLYEVVGETQTLLQSWTLAQLRSTSPASFVVRPDNILPTDFGDLFGTYDGSPLDVTGHPAKKTVSDLRPAECSRRKGLVYKVYGSQDGGQSGIRFYAPYYDSDTPPLGTKHVQTFHVFAGQTFTWDMKGDPDAPRPCPSSDLTCTNPWVASPFNFYGAEQIWKNPSDEVGSPTQAYQRARVFQHGRYMTNNCSELYSIENVAGCQPGHFTGVFKFDTSGDAAVSLATFRAATKENEAWFRPDYGVAGLPFYASPQEVDAEHPSYSTLFVPTQWTPWSSAAASEINGAETLWYMYRTGYERLQLQSLMAPSYGTYFVRGVGFITYNGQKYYGGDSLTFDPAHGLNYSVSDLSMSLVTVTTIACDSLLFDHFSGIAPLKNLSESELEDGVLYRVHKGKGITYQKRVGDASVPTTVTPGQTFTWYQGDSGIAYDLSGVNQSMIRAVEGIRHKNQVPKRGWSNEWCMFMSLNHYHPSISSIWKTDNYGDVMPFLHNRCHTWSYEIKGPKHTNLSLQFAYGQFPPVVSEAPPGYTYLEGINFPYWEDRQVARDYFRSCQVYRQPYEVSSAQIVYTVLAGQTDEDGNQKYDDSTVKIVLKGRLQSTRSAPATIDSIADGSPASTAALRAEPYRTDENALREYLRYEAGGYHCVKSMLGDSSTSFDLFTMPDDPMGACHPRFYFVKLIPYAYEDGNNTVESKQDSLIRVDPYVQMDLYLRAMCGGWMDISSLRSVNCDQGLSSSPVADYLYQNLCYQACRSYGAHMDVTPEIWTGKNFLPLQTVAEYDFAFDPSVTEPLVMEYRTWQLDQCQWGPWLVYQGSISPTATEIASGGTGYNTPPSITLDAGVPSLMKYEKLATPYTLAANTTYYIMSSETSGGDSWHDRQYTVSSVQHPAKLVSTGLASVHAAKYVSGVLTTYTSTGEENSGFGLVGFRTACVGCAHGAGIVRYDLPGDTKNNITGLIGVRIVVGDQPITVYELGRVVLPGSSQSHTVSIRSGSSVTTVLASVNIDATSALTSTAQSDLSAWRAPVFEAVLAPGGSITAVNVLDSGVGFDPAMVNKMKLYVTGSSGSGAELQVSGVHTSTPPPELVGTHEIGGISGVTVVSSGTGYSYPVSVTLSGSFQDAQNLPAQATATVGRLQLSKIDVVDGGSSYTTAQVSLLGGGGQGATAAAVITGGTITEIVLIDPGEGYTSAPTVLIQGDGSGARATASTQVVPGSHGSVVAVTLTPDTLQNYGYSAPPTVEISGGDPGDGSATGAAAVARMQVLNMRDASGMRVIGFEMVPPPYNGLSKISIPYDGPTATKTEFRFSYLSEWSNGSPSTNYLPSGAGGVSVVPQNHLSFNFLPDLPNNPHKYEIKRADFTYGSGCNRTPTSWNALTGTDGVSGPNCENNSNHFQYDDCTTDCACLWPDPQTTHLAGITNPPAPGDIVASTYRIKDLSVESGSGQVTSVGIDTGGSGYSAGATVQLVGGGGTGAEATLTVSGGVITGITLTNPGSGYTQDPTVVITDSSGTGASATAVADSRLQSYYLSWPMQPLVVYNVQRRLFYKFDSDASWHTLAEGVRSPFIDNAPWEENFEKRIEVTKTNQSQTIGGTQTVAAVDSSSATPRSVNINLSSVSRSSYKNVYVDCSVVVTVPIDEVSSTNIEHKLDPLIVFNSAGLTTFSVSDTRTLPQYDGRIVSFKYTVRITPSVTVTWPVVKNHKQLSTDLLRSRLTYKLHRRFETVEGSSLVEVDEVVATSRASGASSPDFNINPTAEEITIVWSGWNDDTHRRLDDSRNNTGFSDVKTYNTEEYYVVATWVDWPETKCIADAQQNRPDCAPLDQNAPCINTNRQYRVESVVAARERWFTAMPMGVNIQRPQGFSPVPNTCTYAEMFNNFANAINLLRYVRLELPFTKRMRQISTTSLSETFWDQSPINCNSIGCSGRGHRRNVSPEGAVRTYYSDWLEVPVDAGVGAGRSLGATGWAIDDCSTGMKMVTSSTSTQFAVDPDQEAFSAIPANLLGNFNISNLALIGKQTRGAASCRLRTGLLMACAADSCCRSYQVQDSWCTCQDSPDEPPYVSSACGCGCRLSIDGQGYARNECRTLWETTDACSVFIQGTVSAPPLPNGDVSWVGGTGFEGNMLCPTGASWTWASIQGIRSLVYMTFPLY